MTISKHPLTFVVAVAAALALAAYTNIWFGSAQAESKLDLSGAVTPTGTITTAIEIQPVTKISFAGSELSWKTGVLEFKSNGPASDAAKTFFNDFLKPYVDQYITERLRANRSALLIRADGTVQLYDPVKDKMIDMPGWRLARDCN